MMNRKLLVLIILLQFGAFQFEAFQFSAFAQEDKTEGEAKPEKTLKAEPKNGKLTLQECVRIALDNSVKLKNAKLDNQLAQAKVGEVRAIGLPQANASVSFSDNFKVPKAFLPGEVVGGEPGTFVPVEFQPQYAGQAGLQINQLVFDGSYFLGLKAARVYTQLSEKAIEQSQIEVTENVSKAYYGVLVSKERMGLVDANIQRIDTLFRQTKILYENGFVEKIDVNRIEVTLNNLKTEKSKLKRIKDLSMSLLKFQMSLPQDEDIKVAGALKDMKFEREVDISFDPMQRIEYRLMQVQENLDEMNIKQYKVQYLPQLGASFSYGFNAGSGELADMFNFSDFWFGNGSIGLQLTIPVFDGLRKQFLIQQGRLSLRKTQNNMADFTRAVDFQVKQSHLQYQNAVESLENQERNMTLAKEVYRVTRIKYEEGVGSSLEVTEAETAYKEAETNYYAALYDALITKIDLKKAQGRLQEDILSEEEK